jgi:hypothetical protein
MFDELHRFGFIEGENLTIDWREYGPRVDLVLNMRRLLEPWPMSCRRECFNTRGTAGDGNDCDPRTCPFESPLLLRLGVMNHDQ